LGFIRRIGRRVARKLVSEPIRDPGGSPAAVERETPVVETGRTLPTPSASEAQASRLVDVDSVNAAIHGSGRVRIVNHWATWCSSCVEELPLLVEISRLLGPDVEMLGVSWDGFQAMVPRNQLVEEVEQCSLEHGLSWGSLVVDADPDTFFEALDLSCHTVPQVWVVDTHGNVVHRVEGPLDQEMMSQLVEWVEAL
jgi:thiol-disulfide isomerase/thioredoxin